MSAAAQPQQFDPVKAYQDYVNLMLANQQPMAKEGSEFPSATLTELNAENKPVDFDTNERLNNLKAKRLVVITVVKGTTPVCTNFHLESYTKGVEALKKAEIGGIVVLSPDSYDVQNYWLQHEGASKTFFIGLPDFFGKILGQLGLLIDRTKVRGLGLAAERAVMVIDKENGKWIIKHIQKEQNPGDKACPVSGLDGLLKVVASLPKPSAA